MILGMLVAIAVPLVFLALVRWLDLYASGSFKGILICLGGGTAAFLVGSQANSMVGGWFGLSYIQMVTISAPIVEEILKSLVLIYAVRRRDFTYFVDGAIYGFAAGTAYAVFENLFYLLNAGSEMGLTVAITRAFSTSLMHGSAAALVGIALGRLRYGRGPGRFASLFLGWVGAMALHITFNNLMYRTSGGLTLVVAIALGLGGLGMVAAFIFWGLAEERRWLRETLGLKVGVSAGEAAVVQKLDDLEALLEPVSETFGPEKRKQVEEFLKLQARVGLKRKVQEITPDPGQRDEMERQVQALRLEIDTIRRSLGLYCMSYVRSIIPPETVSLWARLGDALESREEKPGPSMWEALEGRLEASEKSSDRKGGAA